MCGTSIWVNVMLGIGGWNKKHLKLNHGIEIRSKVKKRIEENINGYYSSTVELCLFCREKEISSFQDHLSEKHKYMFF